MVVGAAAAMPQLQAGEVRPFAVLSSERARSLPNVPTAMEAGIRNLVMTGWYGILAPAGTPRDIVNRLNAEWMKIAAMADTKEKMQKAGVDPVRARPNSTLS